MSQTKTDKATWWSITAFSEPEIEQLNGKQYPDWVLKVYGGMESCPDTGRLHFQGAVQARRQVRFSQVKSWLATAHLEPARSSEALRKYAMKEETAIGEKIERENQTPYYAPGDLLMMLARKARQADRQTKEGWHKINPQCPARPAFVYACEKVMEDNFDLLRAFMNPQIRVMWVEHWGFLIRRDEMEESREGPLVLQAPVIFSGSDITNGSPPCSYVPSSPPPLQCPQGDDSSSPPSSC